MDDSTKSILINLGLDPDRIPPNTVGVLQKEQVQQLSKSAHEWASNPYNTPCLAFLVETEHESSFGLVLRNLYRDERKAHLTVVKSSGVPIWHNLHAVLPQVYDLQTIVLVEGPKDARALYQYGVPAAAYLGASPRVGQLRTATRYAKTVIWIPDQFTDTVENKRLLRSTRESLNGHVKTWIEVSLHIKDPGELPQHSVERLRVLNQIESIIKISSGRSNFVLGNKV